MRRIITATLEEAENAQTPQRNHGKFMKAPLRARVTG
jgi:hypothetical protein